MILKEVITVKRGNMKLDDFKVESLKNEELTSINGGESGWYYLGKAAGALRDFRDWLNEQAGPNAGKPVDGSSYMDLPG